jgi:O-antigen/teichoic acid export membrane protein
MENSKDRMPRNDNSIFSGEGISSIAGNAVYIFGTQGFNFGIRFVYAIALAHYLGPELYGLINYGISWYFTFLSLTGLGIVAILSREIGKDRSSGARITSLTFTLRTPVTVFAAVACGLFAWFIETRPEARIILIVFSIALVGRSLALWAEGVFTAYEVSQFSFRIQVVFRTFEVIAGTGLLLAGGEAMAVAIVHAISWWFQALAGLALTGRRLVPIRFNFSWQDLKSILRQGIPIGIGFVMVNWLRSGPIVLFRHFGSSENSLGQLALAMQSFVVIASVPVAAGMASLPVLSRSVARQDGKESIFIASTIKGALFFGAAAGLAGMGAGPWLVNILFGARYLEAGYLLGYVMWLLIPFTCGFIISRVYFARGEFFLPTVCSGAGALVMTLIMPWMITVMDTSGAVVAMAAGMSVWALSLIGIITRSRDLHVGQALFRPLIVILFALAIYMALKSMNIWLALLTSLAALFCGMMMFGGVTEDEKYLLKHLIRKRFLRGADDSKQSGS